MIPVLTFVLRTIWRYLEILKKKTCFSFRDVRRCHKSVVTACDGCAAAIPAGRVPALSGWDKGLHGGTACRTRSGCAYAVIPRSAAHWQSASPGSQYTHGSATPLPA